MKTSRGLHEEILTIGDLAGDPHQWRRTSNLKLLEAGPYHAVDRPGDLYW